MTVIAATAHTWFQQTRHRLAQTGAAIDLASIMVGVLVIGIVGSVIAATVFAVIPWSQNEAAKQNLAAVATAEAASRVLDGQPMAYDSHPDSEYRLLETQGLERPAQRLIIDTAPSGAWFAVQESATGAVFVRTSASPDAVPADEVIPLLAASGATAFSLPGLSVPATVVPAGISGAAVQAALDAVLAGVVYDFGPVAKPGHGAGPVVPGDTDSNVWDVPDAVLRGHLLTAAGKTAGDQLLLSDAPLVTSLELGSGLGPHVQSLAGLEHAVNLTYLDAFDTQISSLEPIAGLTGLTNLSIGMTGVTDLAPIAGLVNLRYLSAGETGITDLMPIAGLTELIGLHLYLTPVSDVSAVAGLTKLEQLNFHSAVAVSDISMLTGLHNLTMLDIADTAVPAAQADAMAAAIPGIYISR